MIGSELVECREARLKEKMFALQVENARLREDAARAWAAFIYAWMKMPPETTMEEAMAPPSAQREEQNDD